MLGFMKRRYIDACGSGASKAVKMKDIVQVINSGIFIGFLKFAFICLGQKQFLMQIVGQN